MKCFGLCSESIYLLWNYINNAYLVVCHMHPTFILIWGTKIICNRPVKAPNVLLICMMSASVTSFRFSLMGGSLTSLFFVQEKCMVGNQDENKDLDTWTEVTFFLVAFMFNQNQIKRNWNLHGRIVYKSKIFFLNAVLVFSTKSSLGLKKMPTSWGSLLPKGLKSSTFKKKI